MSIRKFLKHVMYKACVIIAILHLEVVAFDISLSRNLEYAIAITSLCLVYIFDYININTGKKKTTLKYKTKKEGCMLRIYALRDFSDIKAGTKGGLIEKEENLSHEGNCWVYENAKVYDNARVYGNARVCGYAKVCDNARVYGNICVKDEAMFGGNADVNDDTDYIVFKNWWSSGRYFTWTRSNNMWRVGCFFGTGEKLIAKAYKDSELSGKEYERIVKYVDSILNNKTDK